MGAGTIFLGILAVGFFLGLVGVLVYHFMNKPEACKPCPPPAQPPVAPSQYFIGKSCPTGFATLADLSIPFKNSGFATGLTAITLDPKEKDTWTLREAKLCKGVITSTIPGMTADVTQNQLYSFVGKNYNENNLPAHYSTARLLVENARTDIPFTPITTGEYSGTVVSGNTVYKYVEARMVRARDAQYVLADSTTSTAIAKLGIEMLASSTFGAFASGATGIYHPRGDGTTGSTYTNIHPIYNVRWSASTLEGFCINQYIDQYTPVQGASYIPLQDRPPYQYTESPLFRINQFNPVNNTISYFNTQCSTDFINAQTSAQFSK